MDQVSGTGVPPEARIRRVREALPLRRRVPQGGRGQPLSRSVPSLPNPQRRPQPPVPRSNGRRLGSIGGAGGAVKSRAFYIETYWNGVTIGSEFESGRGFGSDSNPNSRLGCPLACLFSPSDGYLSFTAVSYSPVQCLSKSRWQPPLFLGGGPAHQLARSQPAALSNPRTPLSSSFDEYFGRGG